MPKRDGRSQVTKRHSGRVKKVKISITISPEVLEWVQGRIGGGKPFGSLSHAFETGIVRLMTEEPTR